MVATRDSALERVKKGIPSRLWLRFNKKNSTVLSNNKNARRSVHHVVIHSILSFCYVFYWPRESNFKRDTRKVRLSSNEHCQVHHFEFNKINFQLIIFETIALTIWQCRNVESYGSSRIWGKGRDRSLGC